MFRIKVKGSCACSLQSSGAASMTSSHWRGRSWWKTWDTWSTKSRAWPKATSISYGWPPATWRDTVAIRWPNLLMLFLQVSYLPWSIFFYIKFFESLGSIHVYLNYLFFLVKKNLGLSIHKKLMNDVWNCFRLEGRGQLHFIQNRRKAEVIRRALLSSKTSAASRCIRIKRYPDMLVW